jgi:hypothetical protein
MVGKRKSRRSSNNLRSHKAVQLLPHPVKRILCSILYPHEFLYLAVRADLVADDLRTDDGTAQKRLARM